MRRFWLLLLLVVLPIQMSWAAVHACEDSMAVGGAVLSALGSVRDAAVAPALDEAAVDEPEQGGSSVHACEGLHELMTDRAHAMPTRAGAGILVAPEPLRRLPAMAARLDRPQWPAA